MKKVLFIASHRKNRSPGQRFRFEQYFQYLEKNNFLCHLSYFISAKDDKILYSKGRYLKKSILMLKYFAKRYSDTKKAYQYDIIFICREALMTRSIYFEKKFKRSSAKIIFDFDDSIWLPNVSEVNRKFLWMKDSSKTSKLISMANIVFAGNQYLSDYALKFNKNVVIVPTTIDTEIFIPEVNKKSSNKICIGWSGSITTIKHFEYAIPALKILKQKYQDNIYFKVIGDANYVNEELDIKGIAWSIENEVKELLSFDIGIMPLPNDEWAKGKCGLKGLSYMALEISTAMSPVGVNTEIIKNGVNGFLTDTIDEWVNVISMLIESKELRNKIGKEARKTVIEKYSVASQKQRYLNYFKQLTTKES